MVKKKMISKMMSNNILKSSEVKCSNVKCSQLKSSDVKQIFEPTISYDVHEFRDISLIDAVMNPSLIIFFPPFIMSERKYVILDNPI